MHAASVSINIRINRQTTTKAVTQFTNVYEYLPKSGPIPFECPLAGALKAKKKIPIVISQSVRGRLREHRAVYQNK